MAKDGTRPQRIDYCMENPPQSLQREQQEAVWEISIIKKPIQSRNRLKLNQEVSRLQCNTTTNELPRVMLILRALGVLLN